MRGPDSKRSMTALQHTSQSSGRKYGRWKCKKKKKKNANAPAAAAVEIMLARPRSVQSPSKLDMGIIVPLTGTHSIERVEKVLYCCEEKNVGTAVFKSS